MFILLPPSATLLTLESTRVPRHGPTIGDLIVRPVDLWIDITFLYQFSHAKKAAKKADMGQNEGFSANMGRAKSRQQGRWRFQRPDRGRPRRRPRCHLCAAAATETGAARPRRQPRRMSKSGERSSELRARRTVKRPERDWF